MSNLLNGRIIFLLFISIKLVTIVLYKYIQMQKYGIVKGKYYIN